MHDFCKNALYGLLTVIVLISFIVSTFIVSSILVISFTLWFVWNYSNLAIQRKLNYIFEI